MARTLLLADDSVTAQNMGRRILTDAGYEVITVNNGSAALKKIHESPPDLVILDVYMPGYGGLEVCQRLKESTETSRIPVLLSVGKMEPFKSEEARKVRADGHIVKPFEASELLAALAKLEDLIIPQAAAGRARKSGKTGEPKKARFWHSDEDGPPPIQAEWSDKIAHLAETKQRHSNPGSVESADAESREPQVELPTPAAERTHVTPAVDAVGELEVVPYQSQAETASTHQVVAEMEGVPANTAAEEKSAYEASDQPSEAEQGTSESATTLAAVTADRLESVEETPVAALSSPNAGDESQSNSAEPPVEASPAAGAQRWVAENVALSAEEACVALEQEMHMAQSQPAAISDLATTAEEPIGQSTPIEDPKAELVEPDGATFAAAASAFASSVNAVSAIASETEVDAPSRSDATAAWQNWEQIRDSVMSPQQASEVAESIAQVAHAAAPPSLGDGEASDAAAIENAALAGIVDSVLAGLKPRLMEEIAKKLAADKKKT